MACAVALATGAGVVLGGASHAATLDPVTTTAATGLQLSILTPGLATSDAPTSLDVSFRGGAIRSVELFVDSAKVFKKTIAIDGAHGSFSLQIENSLLPEGDHEIMVVATEPDGSTATSSMKLHVSGPQVDGIAQLSYPRADSMVQNVVPVEIKLDQNIKAPYVAYLLDNEFVGVRNYAPYVYNWDSSKVSDGPHNISIEVYDSVTQELLKKISVRVIVKNVGGFTTIQPRTPVLKASHGDAAIRAIIGEAISEPVMKFADDFGSLYHTTVIAKSGTVRGTEPHSLSLFTVDQSKPISVVSTATAASPIVDFVSESPVGISSNSAPRDPHKAAANKPSLMRIVETIAEPVLAPTNVIDDTRIARLTVLPVPGGNVASRPRAMMSVATQAESAPRAVAHTQSVAVPHTRSAVAPHADVMPMVITPYVTPPIAFIHSHRINGLKSIEVAFNNNQIAFDVQPRVEHGMPLAPFRAIFEHAGGSVRWYAQSQTIRAVSANRQIEFKIGSRTARVNNRTVKLAHVPYVENGRTIVPISFVQDAMNVKVTYDARKSYLNIESAK